MIKELLSKVAAKQDLSYDEAKSAIAEIMGGNCSPVLISAFLTALAMKGETDDEIAGCADGMRGKALKMDLPFETLDIVGTGGDKSLSFNISTTAAFVLAAAGVKIAKHGNRAASSKCGTADCLEALGVKIDIAPALSAQLLKEINICFLFAQKYHTAMRFVGGVRKEMGIRTLFNILGPLANPAGATMQLLGVYSEDLVEPLAHVLKNLGVKRAMVVYGTDSIDEISLSAPTKVCEFKGDEFKSYEITPEQFGLKRCKKEELIGGMPEENAKIAREILDGKEGPKMDAVLLNAGAAIYLASDNLTMQDAIEKARDIITSGAAKKQLERFVEKSNA